ncbi:Uncharacterised protein [Bordetella pertussis]|nr:Uncharacterised protein [Bordetella pertussis]CFP69283.1 Uncharacterised protein [Bordetella pertussis]CFW07655.1 Uncharacterised protein [Bordetella pertussis]CFW36985.1 Uncharacterised protein [Bordetella pertussis]
MAISSERSVMAGINPNAPAWASANGEAPYRQMPGRTQWVWPSWPTARSA